MRIRIGFSTTNSWISRVIEFFTPGRGLRVSHCFALVEGTELGPVVIEAAWCGCRLGTVPWVGTIVETVDTEGPLNLDVGLRWVGTPYAYAGVLGMAWVCLGRAMHRVWRNPLPDPHHMFCSEMIAYWMQYSGVPGADTLDPTSVSPQALLAWLRARQPKPQGTG